MKETDGEPFTKQRLDELAGHCQICKQLEINGGGEEGPEWEVCNSDHRDDIAIWDEKWGHTLPCPFFETDLRYCAEHEEITTSFMGCGSCFDEYVKEQMSPERISLIRRGGLSPDI